jgi:hypothetical protein
VRRKIAGMIRFEEGVSKKKGSIMSILRGNEKLKELL